MRTPKWIRKAFLAARVHPFGLGPPAPRRWSIGNAARRLRMVRERRPWERRSRQSFRGGETGAGRCRERSPGSLGGETPDFFTWVGRAAHGGHAARTLSREGDAATVTRRRTDRPQWCQVAGMNGSDLEKNRDVPGWSRDKPPVPRVPPARSITFIPPLPPLVAILCFEIAAVIASCN